MAKSAKGEPRAAADGTEPAFEQALDRLEEIVERMESGDLPLEEAMSLFEEGVKLGASCQRRLDEAERKITLLVERADGDVAEEAFDPDAPTRPEVPRASPPARQAARRAAPPAPVAAPPLRQAAFGDDPPDDIPF